MKTISFISLKINKWLKYTNCNCCSTSYVDEIISEVTCVFFFNFLCPQLLFNRFKGNCYENARKHCNFKGQLKRWDKLTSIARFWSPENGFEGIFEKFVFEISAVKVEELCGTNSRFSSFSEKILSGDFCLWRHWGSLLSVRRWCSYRTKEFVSLELGP